MKYKTNISILCCLFIFFCLFGCFDKGGWGTPELLETNDATYYSGVVDPQIGTDTDGNVIAVWTQMDDGTEDYMVWANRYTAGTGWSGPEIISITKAADENIADAFYHPQVDVNKDGKAIAVWSQYKHNSNSDTWDIWAASYTPGEGWGTPEIIDADSGKTNEFLIDIAMDDSGNAIAVWTQEVAVTDTDLRYNIWANRYTTGSGWGTAQLIESGDAGDARDPRAAVSADGSMGFAVWHQFDGTAWSIYANLYTADSGWGTAQLLETSDGEASGPQITVDTEGNAIALWNQCDANRNNYQHIWSNRYTAGEGWGTATLIETIQMGEARASQIAFDDAGNAIAVWQQFGDLRWHVWTNRYVKGLGWGSPESPESTSEDALSPKIGIDGNGDAVAVWFQSNIDYYGYYGKYYKQYYDVWSNRYTAGTGWGMPEHIETLNAEEDVRAGDLQLAVDETGNAVAVWTQEKTVKFPELTVAMKNLWANRFEKSMR